MNSNFWLYLPVDYTPTNETPLVIFLHGAGERTVGGSNDLIRVTWQGLPKEIKNGAEHPFIAVSPQCLQGCWWSFTLGDLNLLLDYVLENYNVDDSRIYLTGLSMGGYGTWAWSISRPQTFASIAPICGGGSAGQAWKIAHLPAWNFHGDADGAVDISYSDTMIEALVKSGSEIIYTVYPGVGHNSWAATYQNPALYEWMMAQVLPEPPILPEKVFSVNFYDMPVMDEVLSASEAFGIYSRGSVVSNWNNVYSSLTNGSLWADGTTNTLTVHTERADGSRTFSDHENTPYFAGIRKETSSAGEVSVTISNLHDNFSNGCYAIVYLSGEINNTRASINDGTRTYWHQTPWRMPFTLMEAKDATDAGIGNNLEATFALFGSELDPLTNDKLTFTLDNVTGGDVALGGMQLISVENPPLLMNGGFESPIGGGTLDSGAWISLGNNQSIQASYWAAEHHAQSAWLKGWSPNLDQKFYQHVSGIPCREYVLDAGFKFNTNFESNGSQVEMSLIWLDGGNTEISRETLDVNACLESYDVWKHCTIKAFAPSNTTQIRVEFHWTTDASIENTTQASALIDNVSLRLIENPYDEWAAEKGLAGCREDDDDKDSISNWAEFVSGHNPTDPASFFAITSIGHQNNFTWNSVSSRLYSVYWASNLFSDFQCMASNIFWSSNSFIDAQHSEEERIYYKVGVERE